MPEEMERFWVETAIWVAGILVGHREAGATSVPSDGSTGVRLARPTYGV